MLGDVKIVSLSLKTILCLVFPIETAVLSVLSGCICLMEECIIMVLFSL